MTKTKPEKNRLARETSPYLLQHDTNPVDWYPWGEEAFQIARTMDKPILLSIGYAACHWCHVMAHESFENEEIAHVMNDLFVNIKVDREERPDIDRIYMDALHLMGEQGGWPLTIFLTPDLKPFWGGTYFPPEPRYGRPSFPHLLKELSRIWNDERSKITSNTTAILNRMKAASAPADSTELSEALLHNTVQRLRQAIDPENGGIGGAPKFPQSPIFNLLWAASQSFPDMYDGQEVWLTMRKISNGGIYDHLAGGIARYTVDDKWLVPHFEKMLYDNAQYISLLCSIVHTSSDEIFRQRIEQSVAWLLSDMTTAEGLFASSYDADSEGEEGKYYVWQKTEVETLLNESTRNDFCKIYDVTVSGNWEGTNILNRTNNPDLLEPEKEKELDHAKSVLLKERQKRGPPGWDDKALLDWNALTTKALFDAFVVLDNRELLEKAIGTLNNLEIHLRSAKGLGHSYRLSQIRGQATADDYAHLIQAVLTAYETTLELKWIIKAEKYCGEMLQSYWDKEEAGFFMAPQTADDLIVRNKYTGDDVTANANSTMIINFWKLSIYTGKKTHTQKADELMKWLSGHMIQNPFSCPTAWLAFLTLNQQTQIILTGNIEDKKFKQLHEAALKLPETNKAIFHKTSDIELPEDHPAAHIKDSEKPAAYICRNQTCSLPITDPEDLIKSGVH